MSLPDYEYTGLMAQAWDVLRGDTTQWADRFYYLDVIRRFGQPVLDVGCGTGRLLLDYLAQGIDIDGVDNSPDMLALCRHKAGALGLEPILYEQFLETLSLPRRYRTILVPSSTIQLIVEPASVIVALQRLRAHLLPSGVVVASVMKLWHPGEPLEHEWEMTAYLAEDGTTFRRVARSRYEPESECESTEDLYQKFVGEQLVAEEVHRRSPATRSYTQLQVRELFEGAGFHPVELYSEFTTEPARSDDKVFTVTGQKSDLE